MYYGLEFTKYLKRNQIVIAKCPDWNEIGFVVCTWNKKEFVYDEQSNDLFSETVIEFIPIDENGMPIKLTL